ncbi:MAG TPA: hypothetical protein VII95_17095 [Terriglobales bacterium]
MQAFALYTADARRITVAIVCLSVWFVVVVLLVVRSLAARRLPRSDRFQSFEDLLIADLDQRARISRENVPLDRVEASGAPVLGTVEASGAPVLGTMEYQQFDEMFRTSVQLKDKASLASALRLRQQATEVVRDVPALYCVGKHHEMILEYNHIGQGIEARQSALESLKHDEEFKDISLVLYPLFRSNFYEESVDYMTSASTSYEEGLYYFAKLKDEFPTEVTQRRYQEFKGLQSKYGRWFSAHRAILGTFYSRASAQMDKGRYAGGLAVLDVILSNAQKPGYNLDYEEYVDLLDDMCALAIRLLMQKGERRPPALSAREEAHELGCILKKPMMYLTDFYPECLPKDRDLFSKHYKSFASVRWIGEVPGWQEFTSVMA